MTTEQAAVFEAGDLLWALVDTEFLTKQHAEKTKYVLNGGLHSMQAPPAVKTLLLHMLDPLEQWSLEACTAYAARALAATA